MVNKQVSVSSTAAINRHTWYLIEDIIPLDLFDEEVILETRNNLAKNISMLPSVKVENNKAVLPTLNQKSCLTDFVGTRSTLIFSLLEIPHSFLNDPEWTERQEYREARSPLQKLIPLNDSSEHALALAESYQELVHVVEEHRK